MLWSRDIVRSLQGCIFLLFVLAGAGCESGSVAAPSEEVARAALEKALTTWKEGGKPGQISDTNPLITVHDTPWSQGERLHSFEILGEEQGTNVEKRFTVRLALTKPDREDEVQYYVIGANPLMVFRDQDYLRNINMEDGPKLVRPSRNSRKTRK